jgi:hypothetical protein
MKQETQLGVFMEKLLREVQEGQACARRVRLICEGTTFETWEPIQAVGIDAEVWARDAETLVQALLAELPKRRVQLSFIAEDSAGATLATVLRTVTGQNPNAQDLGTQNGAKALADAIASVAKTTDFVGEMARKMLDYQAGVIDRQNAQLFEYHELFMAVKKAELEQEEQGSAAGKIMTEQLTQAAPLLMQLLEHVITSKAAPRATSIGGAVASVVSPVTNGAH